jgi:hypothetical protein
MKNTLFLTCSAALIVLLLAACGGKAATTEIPSNPTAQTETTSAPQDIKVPLPVGVFVTTNKDYGLAYCNLQGQTTVEFGIPGLTKLGPDEVVIAGSVSTGPVQVPIIYIENNPEPGLKVNTNDQISPLVSAPSIFKVTGAPGLPVLAYSRVDRQDNGQTYKLFAGTLENIASTSPIVSHFDENIQYVYNPLAVEADDSAIKGVWYTRTPWGVGGVGFLRNYGLYFYDYATGTIKEYLNDSQNFQGLSPDHSKAAIMDESVAGKPVMKVMDLGTSEIISLDVDPGSDSGGGAVQFSPDNRYIAWMEAGGTTMSDTPDYHSRLRVARIDAAPEMVLDLTDEAASKKLGLTEIYSPVPAGWLDGNSLLVNVQGGLMKLDAASGVFSAFCPGSFVAFAYQ